MGGWWCLWGVSFIENYIVSGAPNISCSLASTQVGQARSRRFCDRRRWVWQYLTNGHPCHFAQFRKLTAEICHSGPPDPRCVKASCERSLARPDREHISCFSRTKLVMAGLSLRRIGIKRAWKPFKDLKFCTRWKYKAAEVVVPIQFTFAVSSNCWNDCISDYFLLTMIPRNVGNFLLGWKTVWFLMGIKSQ